MGQVWTNLIFNALQAMNNQGTLRIQTYYKDDQVLIIIQDTGPGIPEAIQGRIFESFFTTKSAGEGTGLGLTIVRDILDRHHGTISFNSTPGNTSFEVCLPALPGLD